jgi:protein TonB
MKKIMIITFLASVTTFSLFAFMAFLIHNNQVNVLIPPEDIPINVMSVPDKQPIKPIVRALPEPPKVAEPPTTQHISAIESDVNTAMTYTPTDMSIKNTGLKSLDFTAQGNSNARPIVRVNPKYPIRAARDGVEGWVVLAFDINTLGEVVNISVIDSQPKRTFDKAAKQALKKWKYKAKSIDGKAVAQHNFSVQLDFNMEQNS